MYWSGFKIFPSIFLPSFMLVNNAFKKQRAMLNYLLKNTLLNFILGNI